jgi:hypothetical protein
MLEDEVPPGSMLVVLCLIGAPIVPPGYAPVMTRFSVFLFGWTRVEPVLWVISAPFLWVISAPFLWVIFGHPFTGLGHGVSVRQALRIL